MEEPPGPPSQNQNQPLQQPQLHSTTFLKSFASICKGEKSPTDVRIRDPTVHKNAPAVVFTQDEVQTMAAHFRYALVGKLRRNPELKTLRAAFLKLGLEGQHTVDSLHPGFILINLQVEEDYNRLWMKQEWFLAGWQPGIPEIASLWDEEWDKFEDDGLVFLALDSTFCPVPML